MAFKTFQVTGLGEVTVYKRRQARNLRVSIQPDGTVRVSIPAWAPYRTGLDFARARADWISRHRPSSPPAIPDDYPIGPHHRLYYDESPTARTVTSRIKGSDIIISYPEGADPNGAAVQTAARKAGIRALRREAEAALPPRLQALARQHGFSYRSVTVKQLKSRWGSCDESQNIALNLFLMLLPPELIDYVLLHELVHTRIMRHGPPFWVAMETVLPDVQDRRRAIRGHRPALAY